MPLAPNIADAELVSESLAGNREAFQQIVERYQSLICSLAYSATGSLNQSEDFAQETFITAWKELPALREPARLRPWLCSIVRYRIGKNFRRQQHEPIHNAEPLEKISTIASPEPAPLEQTISHEEETILWRSLERIPDLYREPLVLFYREHQSIQSVATNLDLSEDAVKQRLSRGRKLLQEQVLAFVEGTLERTRPSKVFTLGVIAALPLLATSAKAATAGTAAKSGAVVKAAGFSAFFQAIFNFIFPLWLFLSLGGLLGYRMGRDATESSARRIESVARFWGILLASIVLFVLMPMLLSMPLMRFFGSKENFLAVMRVWLDVMFGIIVAALVLWVCQRCKSRQPIPAAAPKKGASLFIWLVTLPTLLMVSFFALGLSDTNHTVQYIKTPAAQEIINAKSDAAEFFVMQYQEARHKELWIELVENGKLSKYIAPADKVTLALLAEKGIQCPVYLQGRDFEIFGWQGKALMLLCLFVFVSGVAVLLTLFFKNNPQNPIMTKRTQTAIIAAIILTALLVTPLVVLNHRRANTVHPNRLAQTLTPHQAAQAKQTAQSFFDALGKGDWDKIAAVCPPGYALGDELNSKQKDEFKGLQLISLGEPYKKLPYPGVYVPYDIRFKDGEEKNFNLAVRNDNPDGKWYFDGGF